jgi:mannan endo-1,4-beta-mannosidase
MNSNTLFLYLLIFLIACNSKKNESKTDDQAEQLRCRLTAIAEQGIMFGHQDALAYGIGWNGIVDESDVKRTAGDHPAIFGWDIGDIGNTHNLDGVPFDSIKVYIKRVHSRGGINTISWHARNPATNLDAWKTADIDIELLLPGGKNHHLLKNKLDEVAAFFSELRDSNNKPIPLIFRPWHEMDGAWFWWGSKSANPEQFIKLFRFTVDYLKNEHKLDNLLFAYSPDRNYSSPKEYLERYPGDDYIDILGVDNYGDFTANRLDNVVKKLIIVVDLATEKDKIAAFTETGSNCLKINNWYTSNLLPVLKANNKTRSLAYVLVWRNRDEKHFYVPHPEHEQADDFREFVNDELIFLLNDITKINNNK